MVESARNREWRFVTFDTAALQQAINHFDGSESRPDFSTKIDALLRDVVYFDKKLNDIAKEAKKLSAPSARFICACALRGCKRIASARLLNDGIINEIVKDFEHDVKLQPISRVYNSKLLAGDFKYDEVIDKWINLKSIREVLRSFTGLVWLPDRGCRSRARVVGFYAREVLGIIKQLQPPFEVLGLMSSEWLGENKKLDYSTVRKALDEQDDYGGLLLNISFLRAWAKFEPALKENLQRLTQSMEVRRLSYVDNYEQVKAMYPDVFAKLESISVRQTRDSFIESLSTREGDVVLLPLSWPDAHQYGLTIYRLFRLQDPRFLQIKGVLLTQTNFEVAIESTTGERLQDIIEKNQGKFPLHLYPEVTNCLYSAAVGLHCYKMGLSQISPSDIVITRNGVKIWPLCHVRPLEDDEDLLWGPMVKFVNELIDGSYAKEN